MSLAIDSLFQIDPTQVGDLNTFDDPNVSPNHLTNNIHPIWAYKNWSRNIRAQNTPRMENAQLRKQPLRKSVQRARCKKLPSHIYERILPALRLSSLFLEKSLPWFWNVRYAPLRRFGNRGQRELVLDEEGDWTVQKEQQIRTDLNTIASRYFILHGLHGWEINATGTSTAINLNLDADCVAEDPNDDDGYVIYWQKRAHLITVVAKETVEFIGSRAWLNLPLAIQHRCLFQLALLLMHELAHIVIFFRADDALLNNEPYFRRSEPTREMGFSWEHHMFGGLIAVVDGEFTGNRPEFGIEGVGVLMEWAHDFHSHVQMFSEWRHPRFRMDDLMHAPGRWLVASRSIEQFFDMRMWNLWSATCQVKHGQMGMAPFVVHLSPSVFMSCYQEKSMSFDMWYMRRLYRAAGLVWRDVVGYESGYEDTDDSPPESEDGDEEMDMG